MKIVSIGLNHRTAPVGIREKLAFDSAATIRALRLLRQRYPGAEFVLLSTCNRVELYSASKGAVVRPEDLTRFLAEFHGVAADDFNHFLYVHPGAEAVRHLLLVASSMDSMVVGEVQIINQVKEAYRLACSAKSTGKILNRLFHCAFSTSKKIHSTTSISSGRISVAGFAVELAMQLFENIRSAKVVVIGAGEMGELLVRHFLHAGCGSITVVNRSYGRCLERSAQLGVQATKWEELDKELAEAHIVVGSAATREYLFKRDFFVRIMRSRRRMPLLIIDIAVPRNFEPSINEIDDVYLYSVDDLSDVVEQNRKAREADMAKGMHTIQASVRDFMDWLKAQDIGPLIGQMRERFAEVAEAELRSFFVGSRRDASCRAVMEMMVRRVVNRLLHCVISNINAVAREQGAAEAAKLVESIVKEAKEITVGPSNKGGQVER